MDFSLGELIKLSLVGLSSGIISNYIANRSFRHKKWWELRVSAYQNAIEALSDIVHYYDVHKKTWDTSGLSDKKKESLEIMISEANSKLRKLADSGAFLFSNKAEEVLRKFFHLELGEIFDPDDIFIPLEQASRECLKNLVQLSKKDLKVRSYWWS